MTRYLMVLAVSLLLGACATSSGNVPEESLVKRLNREMAAEHYGAPGMPAARGSFPQSWGTVHRPIDIDGCDRGPLALEIRNETEYFLRLQLDGEDVALAGSKGNLPLLPPGERVYVCLDSEGEHHITGVAYARRGREIVESERFSVRPRFRADRRGAYPRHIYWVTEYIVSNY